MKILSINVGSSSIKFGLYNMPKEELLISGLFEKIGAEGSCYTISFRGNSIKKEAFLKDYEVAINILTEEILKSGLVASLEEIRAVGHRVVHGGDKYYQSVIVTEEVLKDLEEFSSLAPIHNPMNILGIQMFNKVLSGAIPVAVFDTAFHQTMEKEDYLYSVPYDWYTEYKVRKYGFHGTSHRFLVKQVSEKLQKEKLKIITCHLGNGGSISAIENGKCLDTSMGFTPNAGIMMGTRSGDIDSTIIPYIMEKTNKSLDEITNELTKNSGLLGISKFYDYREIEKGIINNDVTCLLTHKMFIKRVVNYIASYYVRLNGADVICFAGGIGENSSKVRKDILNSLSVLGIKVNDIKNQLNEEVITNDDSTVIGMVIPTDEELMIALDTYWVIK